LKLLQKTLWSARARTHCSFDDSAICSASDTATLRDNLRPDPGVDGSELGLVPAKKAGKGDAACLAVGVEEIGGGGRTKGWPEGEQGAKSLEGGGGYEEGRGGEFRLGGGDVQLGK